MVDFFFSGLLAGHLGDWLNIPIKGNNPRLVINVVSGLLMVFLLLYLFPAVLAAWRLYLATKGLETIRQQKPVGETVSKEELQQVFSAGFFANAWNGFRDTLHEQYGYQDGQRRLESIRSTVPAEAIFSPQSLVDARLHVEFFKHLPGILTGIGIIGTFYGLINGIKNFHPELLGKVKTDPTQMDKLFNGLTILFEEVQSAFIASFFAIGAAMAITFLEKVLLNACYRRLEKLCQALDNLYTGGVGEDYLASLVKSSADNATQTKHLKESLVSELSELLRDLTSQQIKQSEALGSLLSAKIQEHIDANKEHGEEFRKELKEGLAEIGTTVKDVTGGQSDTITGMLESLVKSFSDNIKNRFDSQMQGLADMMNTSVASMKEMQGGFKSLLEDLRESGAKEREDLTAKVTTLVETLGEQQGKLQGQIEVFISSIQDQIGESQKQTMAQVRESLQDIQGSVGIILTEMSEERKEAIAVEQERQREFAETSKRLVSDMGVQVGGLVGRSQQAVESMGEKVSGQLNESLSAVHASVQKLLTDMEKERQDSANTERELHRQFTDTSKQLVLDMENHINTLLEGIKTTVVALDKSVTALSDTSIVAIKGMDTGATNISLAAEKFTEAGNVVSGVMQQAEAVSSRLSGSSDTLAQASRALENQLSQYASTREALAKMVAEMNGMLERAKQEAGMNQQIVEDMRRMVASFGILKDDMDEFVDSVSKLLAETMAKFRQDMGTHNVEFHKHHADTLNQVASAYQPLADAIGGLIDMMAKTGRN